MHVVTLGEVFADKYISNNVSRHLLGRLWVHANLGLELDFDMMIELLKGEGGRDMEQEVRSAFENDGGGGKTELTILCRNIVGEGSFRNPGRHPKSGCLPGRD